MSLIKLHETQGSGRRILVTRPQPAAKQTAERLKQLGFSPVLLPLSRTAPLDFSVNERPFAALTVTSANAFQHIPDAKLAPYRSVTLFAVGEGTARAAHAAGFTQVVEGGGDAVRLAATMADRLPMGAEVLYLAGRVRQPVFESEVKKWGLNMVVHDVYDTLPCAYSAVEIHTVLDTGPFAAVLLYSGVSSKVFVDCMVPNKASFGSDVHFLCISQRVADFLPTEWQANALVADHPDENGIFRLLSKL